MKTSTPVIPITFAPRLLWAWTVRPGGESAAGRGYAGGNTAEGENALASLTTGTFNTAIGWRSLHLINTARYNTGVGAGTLFFNTAEENTATGAGALFTNIDGGKNTATGAFTLYSNFNGVANTAVGSDALPSNNSGASNTAIGASALFNNFIGARTRPWARESDSIRRLALAMYISVLARRALLARATAATSQVFLTKRLPAEPRFSLTQTISSARVLPQSGSRKTSSRWIKQGLFSFKPVVFRYKQEIDPDRRGQFGLVAEDVEKINPTW